MKTSKSITVFLFVLLTAQIASAYYCPSTGRWLSRDPIGEPGFQTSQMASLVPSSLQLSANRWINRDPSEQRGEPNLTAMANNTLINNIDILGLTTDESLTGRAEWQCKPCKCKSVTVTYEPGGNSVQLGPYNNWWDHYTYGSKVHVSWTVEGRPSHCKYYQDEQGTFGTVTQNGKTLASIAGVDGHQAPQDYTDKMGFNFGTFWNGTYTMTLVWSVTFRCVSSDGSVVSRHDSSTVTANVTVPFW